MKFGMSTALASLAALIAVVVTGCSADESLGAVDTLPAAEAQRSSPAKAPHAGANRRGAAVPPELRADYIRAVQAQAGEAYRVEPAGADTLRARSAAQGLLAERSPEGVRLMPAESGSTSASLALAWIHLAQDPLTFTTPEPIRGTRP
jgi:hypothetical protein